MDLGQIMELSLFVKLVTMLTGDLIGFTDWSTATDSFLDIVWLI